MLVTLSTTHSDNMWGLTGWLISACLRTIHDTVTVDKMLCNESLASSGQGWRTYIMWNLTFKI